MFIHYLAFVVTVGTTQSVERQAMDWVTGVRFPAGSRDVLMLYYSKTGSVTQPASYPVGIGGNAAEA